MPSKPSSTTSCYKLLWWKGITLKASLMVTWMTLSPLQSCERIVVLADLHVQPDRIARLPKHENSQLKKALALWRSRGRLWTAFEVLEGALFDVHVGQCDNLWCNVICTNKESYQLFGMVESGCVCLRLEKGLTYVIVQFCGIFNIGGNRTMAEWRRKIMKLSIGTWWTMMWDK